MFPCKDPERALITPVGVPREPATPGNEPEPRKPRPVALWAPRVLRPPFAGPTRWRLSCGRSRRSFLLRRTSARCTGRSQWSRPAKQRQVDTEIISNTSQGHPKNVQGLPLQECSLQAAAGRPGCPESVRPHGAGGGPAPVQALEGASSRSSRLSTLSVHVTAREGAHCSQEGRVPCTSLFLWVPQKRTFIRRGRRKGHGEAPVCFFNLQ